VFHHRDILCSFLRQSNRSGGRSIASFVGVAVPGGRGGAGCRLEVCVCVCDKELKLLNPLEHGKL
jgi:hypothetical protein